MRKVKFDHFFFILEVAIEGRSADSRFFGNIRNADLAVFIFAHELKERFYDIMARVLFGCIFHDTKTSDLSYFGGHFGTVCLIALSGA